MPAISAPSPTGLAEKRSKQLQTNRFIHVASKVSDTIGTFAIFEKVPDQAVPFAPSACLTPRGGCWLSASGKVKIRLTCWINMSIKTINRFGLLHFSGFYANLGNVMPFGATVCDPQLLSPRGVSIFVIVGIIRIGVAVPAPA
jgi:hypothetical protein